MCACRLMSRFGWRRWRLPGMRQCCCCRRGGELLMLIAMVSGKAAPGVTTSTWALSMAWPGPVLVVDADPAGGDMAAGLLLGRMRAGHGVLSWSAAARRMPAVEASSVIGEHVVALPE